MASSNYCCSGEGDVDHEVSMERFTVIDVFHFPTAGVYEAEREFARCVGGGV